MALGVLVEICVGLLFGFGLGYSRILFVEMAVVKQILGTFLAAWYLVPWVFAVHQEVKLGWPRFDLSYKIKIAILFLAMEVVGTYHQFIVLAYHLMFGVHEGRKFCHRRMESFYSWFIPIFFGRIQSVQGLENIPKDEACIFVANHQCTADFAMFFAMPPGTVPGLCPVAKTSILAMPGFGLCALLGGGVMIERGKKGTLEQMVEQGTERLESGLSIVLFPQGTRRIPTATVPPLEFKRGFAILAAKTKARVVPVTFNYPLDYMSDSRDINTCGVKVIFHPPVAVDDNDNAIHEAMKAVQATVTAPILDALKEDVEGKKVK